MARISRFTRTVLRNRSNPSNIAAAAAAGGGNRAQELLISAGQAQRFGSQVSQINAQLQKQKAAEGKVNTAQTLNVMDSEGIEELDNLKSERQATPNNFAQDYDDILAKRGAEMETTLSASDQNQDLDYFRIEWGKRRTRILQSNTDWERGLRVKNAFIGMEEGLKGMSANFALSNPNANDLVAQQERTKDYVNDVGGGMLSPADQITLMKSTTDRDATIFFNQQLQENPGWVKRVLDFGLGGRDRAIEHISEFEKGRGAKTQEEIESVWDAKLEEFEPAFQAIAFDALVSHGVSDKTWKMIKAADENPLFLLRLRREEYARLLRSNPEKFGKEEPRWNQRLEELNAFVADLKGGGADLLQNAVLVDPEIISKTRGRIDEAISAKKRKVDKEAKEANEANEITQINNQNILLDQIEADDLSYDEKMLSINSQEVRKEINQDFAADARRYVESKKAINAVTNSDLMADIVTEMYDLNTLAELDEKEYLLGIQNLKRNIMSLRTEGTLSRDDEIKLNNQLRTLTASKQAEATSQLSFSFGEANSLIKAGLPPELRGKATRELFYKVSEETAKLSNLSAKEERKLYKKHARSIIDGINADRRDETLGTVDQLQNQVILAPNIEAEEFLEKRGFTMDDVRETANKYGISERQVIERLRNQGNQ